jgi:hypothetical protein
VSVLGGCVTVPSSDLYSFRHKSMTDAFIGYVAAIDGEPLFWWLVGKLRQPDLEDATLFPHVRRESVAGQLFLYTYMGRGRKRVLYASIAGHTFIAEVPSEVRAATVLSVLRTFRNYPPECGPTLPVPRKRVPSFLTPWGA